MKSYTVVGLYISTHERFATCVESDTPESAEEIVLADNPNVRIAGVIEGDVSIVG